MPYYIYKISSGPANLVKNLEYLSEFEKYRDAKNFVKTQRQEMQLTAESEIEVRMILAENALDAEEKLQEKRERPILQEWEK